jgi:predicted amidohydrolase
MTGEAHWHVLTRARAIENTAFMISPCAVGPVPGGGESYGHSLVVSPWGEVLADGGDLPGVLHTQIDLDDVNDVASRIPSLQHDRTFTLHGTRKRHVA